MTIRILLACGVVGILVSAGANGQQIRSLSIDQTGKRAASGEAPAVSADGRYVSFDSISPNLVDGDTNHHLDVFVRDRVTGTIERVSVADNGTQGNFDCFAGGISDDGRYVVFWSESTNLVPGDTNGFPDVFLHDRSLGTTILVSVSSAGVQGNSYSSAGVISGDGSTVAFVSLASNLVSGDTNGFYDIFVRDLAAGTTERASVSTTGGDPNANSRAAALTGDGGLVAFISDASNLVAGDANKAADAFVFDRASATTTRVDVSSAGAEANGSSDSIAITRDGSFVAFDSNASNLASAGGSTDLDVFVRDLVAGTTECVSVRSDGSDVLADSYDPSLSDDGHLVAFVSQANDLVDGDTNDRDDVFLHDRSTAATTFGDQTSAGNLGDGDTREPALDSDGGLLVFSSWADNFSDVTDRNGEQDIFANDLTFVVDDASWSNYGDGWPGTFGVPAFTASAPPAFGTSFTLDVTSSTGFYTIGFLLIGMQQADLPTNLGGTLLVDFDVLQAVLLDPGTTSLPVSVPRIDDLANVSLFLQVIEEDDGASRAFSFTPGLELHVGR